MKRFDQSPERGGFNQEQYQKDLIDALGAQNEYWKATLDLLAKKELEHPMVIPNTVTRNGDLTVPDGMMSIRATTNQTAPVTITANGNIPIPVSSAYGAQQVTTGRLISLSVNGLQAGNIIWVQMLNERASMLNAYGNSASVELTGRLPLLDSTTTALGVSGTYTTSNAFLLSRYKSIVGSAYSDQSGTLLIEQSQDGINWDVQSTVTVTGGSPSAGFDVDVVGTYGRLNYTNGATAQTVFRLYARGKTL